MSDFICYTFDSYQCGGKSVRDTIWLRPGRIIGIRPRTMGHTETEILIDGAEPKVVLRPPDFVLSAIEAAERKHLLEAQRRCDEAAAEFGKTIQRVRETA